MSEEKKDQGEGTEDSKSRREKVGDGFKHGVGVLSAFKDALEETIQEARERGDLSTDRAKEVMKDALERAQTAAEGARERLDFVSQTEMDGLASAMESIRARVSDLEESVFGGSKEEATDDLSDDAAKGADSDA